MFLSKRNGVYYLWYEDDTGTRHKISTRSKRKRDALAFLQSFRSPPKHTFGQPRCSLSLFYSTLREYLVATHRSSTVEIYDKARKHLRALAGEIELSNLSRLHYDRYKLARLKTISQVTVNIELRAIRASLAYAVRWKQLLTNPFSSLPLTDVPQKSPVAFTECEASVLVSRIKEGWMKDLVALALMTGMRRGELLNLHWSDIDLDHGHITIESKGDFRTKSGKRRTTVRQTPCLSAKRSSYTRSNCCKYFSHFISP